MKTCSSGFVQAFACAALFIAPSMALADEWAEYENPATGGLTAWSGYSTDPRVESRRTDHFLIRYGHERQEGGLVEQTGVGHLQYLENCYDTWLSLGFTPGLGGTGTNKFKSVLHVAKTFPGDPAGPVGATGFMEGGASGCNVPISYLGYRDGNGATPHEFGHGWGTKLPSFFSEGVANWIEQQAIMGYPGDWPAVGITMSHAANYYNMLSIFNYFMEAPGYGAPFLMKLFYEPNLNDAPLNASLDDIIRKAIRCDTSGAADKAGAIHDGLGMMNAKILDIDFWNKRFNNLDRGTGIRGFTYDMDLNRHGFHFNRIPMVRQPGVSGTWYRPEFSMIPQSLSQNFIPLSITATGSLRTVTCDFRPVADAVRGTSFRACFVAFNMNKEPRYSAVWNAGEKSFTLADDENAVYLAIIACPYALNTNLQHNDYTTDNVAMFPYRLSLTGANPKGWQWAAPTSGFTRHANGGGIKATTATVDPSAYIGTNAMVLGTAKVYGNSRIEDYAVVDSSATIGRSGQSDDPVVSGHAYVTDTAQVYGHGKVRDYGWVFGSSKVYENGIVMAHSVLNGAQVFGSAVLNQTSVRDAGLSYSGSISGCAIIGGDTSGGSPFDKGVYCEFPGLSVLDNAYQYLGYNFEKTNCVFAMDQYGMNHSYLMNEPQVVGDTVNGISTKVIALDPLSSQYVEIRPDAVDFPDLTISMWVKPLSLATDQMIFSFGDGSNKVMRLTARDTTTFPGFEISNGSSTQVLAGTTALQTNVWTHLAVTLAGNTGTFYVGGTQVSQNVSMTIDPDQLHAPLMENANYLGRGNAGAYFQGRIDEFRVYNKALNASEVAALLTSITTSAAPTSDTTPPTPNAATWLVNPTVTNDNAITMSATEGTDAGGNGVLYYFRCVTDSSHDSGWLSENKYTDFKGAAGTTYTYTVRMKDKNGNTGTESTQLSAVAPVADTTAPTPNPPTFAFGPLGSSTTSITMTATAAIDNSETVLYKFSRVGSAVNSGWTSSRTWTDTGLTPGATHSYTLQLMDGHSNSGTVFTSSSVVARDDTPPELETDFRLQWAILPQTQLDKSVRMCVVEPVETAVDYYYECVESPAINSGWTSSRTWVTPAFAMDGTNSFRFKLRDRSPQLNQSGWSATKTAKILPSNSYHDYALSQLATLPNSTLVRFSGTVSEVATNYYIVTNATASIKVVPRSYYTATDVLLLNKSVDVQGHLWTYTGTPKRVTEAFVRGNQQSGKVEFENGDYTDEHGALRTDAGASGLEYLGGFPVGYFVTFSNVAASTQMTVRHRGGSGTISLYVNGTHDQNLTLPYLSTWGQTVFTGLAIPAGATLKFQRDADDVEMDLDYVIVGPSYAVSGKVTSSAGGANISGATVYFSDHPNASVNSFAATTTTDASGNYSYAMYDGPWYLCAAKDGYNTSTDQTVVVNGGAVANVNFALLPNVIVSGKVTDQNGGTNISGASVYFAASSGGVPVFTAQTTADGDLSQSIQNGTWYVHAGKTGYYPTFEQVVVVNGVALTNINFQLEANPKTVPQTGSLYFHVDPDSFTADEGAQTGNWQLQYLEGVNVATNPTKYVSAGNSPTMEVRGAIKWERNTYDEFEGYEVQNRTVTPILPFNGATFVAVIKPTLRTVSMAYGGQYIFNVGYNGAKGFALIMANDTGEICFIRNGVGYRTYVFIPDGQKTVLSCVVQPNGSFILYANGLDVYTQTATNSFVNVDLSANFSFQQKVTIGTGCLFIDGEATYNGNIGDVMAYYAPLSGTDRAQLETHLMKKFTIGGIMISATAGAGGSIAPSGTVVVAQGGSQTFTVTPDSGYLIQSLLIDGISSPATNSYTFSNVLASHTISAIFETLPHTTAAGTATAVASGQTGIVVTMPYTDDANTNNTYTVEYKFSSGSTWTAWVTAAAHVASPYTTTITGLTPGTSYDIRVTYNDADGLTGSNPQIIPSVTTLSLSSFSLNSWTNVFSTATNNAAGTVNVAAQTVSAGSNRLFVVAVCMESAGTVSGMNANASLGGKPLTPIASSSSTGREFATMAYLKEADIPAGASTLSVTYGCTGSTISGLHIKWASYTDVEQTVPIYDSNANYNGAITVTFGSQIDYLKGGLVFYVAANGNTPASMTAPTDFSTVSGASATSSGHSSHIGSTAVRASTGNYAGTTSVAFTGTTSARSALVVASLRPAKVTPSLMVTNSPVTHNGSAQAAIVNGSVTGTVSNVKYDGSATAPSAVGTYAITANFEPTDTVSYHSLTNVSAGSFVIQKALPTVTVANSPASYTGAAQAALVNGSVAGNVSNVKYDGSATAPTAVGSYAVTANFAPTDTASYISLTNALAGSFVIQMATPTVSVTNSPATYTGAAQAALVNGSVAGTVSNVKYDGSATVPSAVGSYAVTADFAPTDAASYNSLTNASAGSFVIQKAMPTVSVANSPVTYTGAAQAALVNGSVAGTVSNVKYDGSAIAPSVVGSYAVTADFAPTDTASYNSLTNASAGSFVIQKATPTITVTNSPATYTGAAQAALVNGSVTGTVSNVKYDGSATAPTEVGSYSVTADFAPTDPANYESLTSASAGSFTIQGAALTITATGPEKTYGTALNVHTNTTDFIVTGLLPSDGISSVTLTPDAAGQSATTPAGGTYGVTPSQAVGSGTFTEGNYQITYVPFNGTVGIATPVVEWNNPATIVTGTPLGGKQLNATCGVAGAFAYTPPAGTVLPLGADQPLRVQFTPEDLANYAIPAEKQVRITVTAMALAEDFEHEWADNDWVIATNGWSFTGDGDLSRVIHPVESYGPLSGGILFPLDYDHEAYKRILSVNTDGNVLLSPSPDAQFSTTKVTLDMMVKSEVCENLPMIALESIQTKASVFLLGAGATTNLMVFHGKKEASGFGEPRYTAVTNMAIPEQWCRLTLIFDAVSLPGSAAEAFQVYVNGQVLSSSQAYSDTWKERLFTQSYAPDGGTWFLSAGRRTSSVASAPDRIGSVGFQGTGFIDDLLVTYADPRFANFFTITQLLGPNGWADPAGTITIPPGATTSIVYTADQWYRLAALTNDQTAVATASNARAYTNTFRAVNADHTVQVAFKPATATQAGIPVTVPTDWAKSHYATEATAAADTNLATDYLFNLNPVDEHNIAFSITALAVNGTHITVTVELKDGVAPLSTTINGTLKLKGKRALSDADWTDIAEATIIQATFGADGRRALPFTDATYKFYKGVIVPQ